MEGFRVLSYDRIDGIMVILMLAASFLCQFKSFGGRLLKKIYEFSQSLYEIPEFVYYRVVRGIRGALEGIYWNAYIDTT